MNRHTCAIVAVLLAAPLAMLPAYSQTPPPPAAAAAPAPASTFTQEQIDQMLASIALYPDALLSQVLMASTYPLELVEAERWAKAHPSLSGQALADALKDQPWDESVKSLTAFPEVLARMNKDLTWTQQLGDAFLGQQAQVMESVQRLRQKAKENGNLASNEQQKVTVENNYITVEPANPQVVYVPTYNPTVVYGAWWYPSYPPYYPPYWAAPGTAFVRGVAWGVGIAAGAALWGGFNWNNNDVNINVNRYNNFNKTNISNGNWSHNGAHRDGVPYRDNGARQKYGADNARAAQSREQYRGRDAGQAGQFDRGGQSAGQRPSPSTADRNPTSANRAAQQSAAGNRASDRGGSFNVNNGAQTRDYSNRGASSMNSRSAGSAGAARSGGGGGGGRGGGGGGRGGGGRR